MGTSKIAQNRVFLPHICNTLLRTLKGAKFALFNDLTINTRIYIVILFEKVKVMIANTRTQLCFGGDSPQSYVKQSFCYVFFLPRLSYQAK